MTCIRFASIPFPLFQDYRAEFALNGRLATRKRCAHFCPEKNSSVLCVAGVSAINCFSAQTRGRDAGALRRRRENHFLGAVVYWSSLKIVVGSVRVFSQPIAEVYSESARLARIFGDPAWIY
ncbi:MAG: hypothetical protein DMF74_14465 [Acidobacteria bacterium]|nr:MAG: hypothetical protein DMF74_14465 [Acidobacteriota bacterium]